MINIELKNQLIDFTTIHHGFPYWEKRFAEFNNVTDSFIDSFIFKYGYDLPSYSNRFFFKTNLYRAFRSIGSDRRKMLSIMRVLEVKYKNESVKFAYKWNPEILEWVIYVSSLDLFIDDGFTKFTNAFKPTYKINFKISLLTDMDGFINIDSPKDNKAQMVTVSSTFKYITPSGSPLIRKEPVVIKKPTKEEELKIVSRIKEILSV